MTIDESRNREDTSRASEIADLRRLVTTVLDERLGTGVVADGPTEQTVRSPLDALRDLGLMDAGRPDQAGGLGLPGACELLTVLASRWGSLAWSALPELLLATLDVESDGLVGLAAPQSADDVDLSHVDASRFEVTGTLAVVVNGDVARRVVLLAPGAPVLVLAVDPAADASVRHDYDGFVGACHANLCLRASSGLSLAAPPERVVAAHRILTAAVATGLAHAGVTVARTYLSQRVQFKRILIEFGEMRSLLARAHLQTVGAEMLIRGAASSWVLDCDAQEDEAAACLYRAAEVAAEVTERAQHAFGGYGHMQEFPVSSLVRDAKFLSALALSPDGGLEDDALRERT